MLQQIVKEPGKIEFKEMPVPEIAEDQVLIKIKKIGICGLDIRVFQGADSTIAYPVTQGREASGEIVLAGNAVQNLFPGQKVTVQPQVTCGECRNCLDGKYNLCEKREVMGFQLAGMASEYFAVDADKVAPLSENISYEEGTMVEALAVAVHGVKKAGNINKKKVLILGAGPVGITTAQAAMGMGAASVMITDISDARIRAAKESGIPFCINTSKENLGEALLEHFGTGTADVVYDCAGTDVTLQQSVQYAAPGSRIILVAVVKGPSDINLELMLNKELKLYTTIMYRNEDYLDAIGLLEEKKVNLMPLISRHFVFKDYEKAYRYIAEKKDKAMKVIIDL